MGDFGGICKVLTISRLNFINTNPESKTGLKKPKRACKRGCVKSEIFGTFFFFFMQLSSLF